MTSNDCLNKFFRRNRIKSVFGTVLFLLFLWQEEFQKMVVVSWYSESLWVDQPGLTVDDKDHWAG
jgi:hypothetical protein